MTNVINHHLILISFDAVTSEDYNIISDLTNFSYCINEGSYVKRVKTIYPSLTYPAHATIVTGKYPKNHGIINNTLLQPGQSSPDWYWYRKDIVCDTIYDLARKANLSVASLLWPVTGKANIKYNMPEIFPNRKYQNQIMVSLLNGSPLYQFELNSKFGSIREGLNQPELDNFILASTIHTIKKYKPNLTLIHFTDVDTMRHRYGTNSKEAMEALVRHDCRLGTIIKALKESNIYENSTLVLLGDHGFIDVKKTIALNSLFKDRGLITVNNEGKITDWKAYVKSCDGSAYIYLKDKKDKKTFTALKELIYSLKNQGTFGIDSILTGKEASKWGADSSCAFMLEAENSYYFVEDHEGDIINTIESKQTSEDSYPILGAHGYSPKKSALDTLFIATGKGIKKGLVLEEMNLVDVAPTIAKILDLNLKNVDGKAIKSILK